MNTRSPYWKLVIVEERERIGSDYYLKLTYWNGIDTYYYTRPPAPIPHEFIDRDAAEERYAYLDFLRALPDDQCREIVNARRFLQVVHQAMSEASKPKVGDGVYYDTSKNTGVIDAIIDRNTVSLAWHTLWNKNHPINQVKPVVLPYRLAECQAAFAPEHHKELAELIYLHDGDLRERWMLFTDMLEEGRWGDKYQPWAKHILEVIENLGRPLTIYDEVFESNVNTAVRIGARIYRFSNLIISGRYRELDNEYCIVSIFKLNEAYDKTYKIEDTSMFFTIPDHMTHLTSPTQARPESNA